MNTVQIFRSNNYEELQELINEFFDSQTNIVVVQMLQSESVGMITITIFYKIP